MKTIKLTCHGDALQWYSKDPHLTNSETCILAVYYNKQVSVSMLNNYLDALSQKFGLDLDELRGSIANIDGRCGSLYDLKTITELAKHLEMKVQIV